MYKENAKMTLKLKKIKSSDILLVPHTNIFEYEGKCMSEFDFLTSHLK